MSLEFFTEARVIEISCYAVGVLFHIISLVKLRDFSFVHIENLD